MNTRKSGKGVTSIHENGLGVGCLVPKVEDFATETNLSSITLPSAFQKKT